MTEDKNDTTKVYSYSVFGICVIAQMELKALMPLKAAYLNQKIYINWRKVSKPEANIPNTKYTKNTIINPGFFYLSLEEVAQFYLMPKNENELNIDIDLQNENEIDTMFTWLYGSVFTAALMMLNRFALHASGVLANNKVHLFCGESGIGKSTIAAQLTAKGYRLFTDDKCVVNWSATEEQFLAQPSLQIIRLWKDATDKMDNPTFLNEKTAVTGKVEKYQYQLEEQTIIQTPKQLAQINVIERVEARGALSIIELSGMEKLNYLVEQSHRKGYIKHLGKSKVHWEFLSQLVNQVPVCWISRPLNTSIEDFVAFVEQYLTKNN